MLSSKIEIVSSLGWPYIFWPVEITNISVAVISSVADINFLVKKVYDINGSKATNGISFKWRLKNSNGLVIKNGSWYRESLMIGDVTEGRIQINGISSLEKYVLEFLDN